MLKTLKRIIQRLILRNQRKPDLSESIVKLREQHHLEKDKKSFKNQKQLPSQDLAHYSTTITKLTGLSKKSTGLTVKMLKTRKEFEEELGDFDIFRTKVREQSQDRKQTIKEMNSDVPEPIDFEVVKSEPVERKQLGKNNEHSR